MTTGTRKPGDFCWFNMITPAPEQARAFFSAVVGWTYVEMPGVGFRVQVRGHDIGAIYDQNAPQTPPGTPPHIGVMVMVVNADATVARIAQLGGKAMPPFDVFDAGRMAVCFDPNGANFDLWEPRKMTATDADSRWHGAATWFETITSDVPRATAFYNALFGWTSQVTPMEAFDYTVFFQGDAMVAGMFPIQPNMGAMPSHWGVYFAVDDVDAAAATAGKLGAHVEIPPTDIPNVGRFSGIVSPQGVMFYLITYPS